MLMLLLCVGVMSMSAQEPLSFERVIHTDSIGKSMLYSTINSWFVDYYKSAGNVIQMSDKEAGIIIGKGSTKYGGISPSGMASSHAGRVSHKVEIYVKEDRCKVIVSSFSHKSGMEYKYPAFSLGLITSDETYTTKGMYKRQHNKIWTDLKTKSKRDAEDIFDSIADKIKDVSFGKDASW